MNQDDIAISVANLSKTYRLFQHPADRLKQFFSFGMRTFHREFTALKNISFEVTKGEIVGIIGHNGSGKSTLLQVICGILKPTSGNITVDGRISALLELGAGFNPEFTGRENVYFQGALMGFSRAEMDLRFDDIAAFADIGQFIDQPIRIYSSGMFVRLAFAVAVSLQPDILVVDEALAVGDAKFQARCFRRIRSIHDSGGTVLFVTHAVEQVLQMCSRALLLDHGELKNYGAPEVIVNEYSLKTAVSATSASQMVHRLFSGDETFHLHPSYRNCESRWGNGGAAISAFALKQQDQENPISFFPGHPVNLAINVRFFRYTEFPIYGLTLKTADGATLFTTNSNLLHGCLRAEARKAGESIWVVFEFTPWLEDGEYLLSVGVAEETPDGIVPLDRRYDAISLTMNHWPVDAEVMVTSPAVTVVAAL